LLAADQRQPLLLPAAPLLLTSASKGKRRKGKRRNLCSQPIKGKRGKSRKGKRRGKRKERQNRKGKRRTGKSCGQPCFIFLGHRPTLLPSLFSFRQKLRSGQKGKRAQGHKGTKATRAQGHKGHRAQVQLATEKVKLSSVSAHFARPWPVTTVVTQRQQ